jgi:serine/threonine protein kinase/Tol biopolymer transport system component
VALAPGTRLGAYDIVALIGSGGMGEVYRARDPRLGRDVAVKVLPAAVSTDPDRLHRFEQEARAAAALNHPNILTIHEVGTAEGAPYVVSELLDGQTLREVLGRGALTTRTIVAYAVQILSGLAAAHDKGIVHRDLKPENLFVTIDGRLKILDFGLAKLLEPVPAGAGLSMLATLPADTVPGVALGTIGYMSPEQVRGQMVDHRSDLVSIGAILYELLAGERPFRGDSPADTISAILRSEPRDLSVVTAGHVAPGLERIVQRCLEKEPGRRFQSTRDLAFALETLESHSGASAVISPDPVPIGSTRRERTAWLLGIAMTILSAILAVPAAMYLRLANAAVLTTRLDFVTPPTADPLGFALSPDGRRLAFVTDAGLSLRSLDETVARSVPGTEGAQYPFWSPDSQAIGFFASGQLKRIDLASGAVHVIASTPLGGRGGTWSDQDTILFAGASTGGLQRVAATGGTVSTVIVPSAGQVSDRFPQFLPDGRHFLFYMALGPSDQHGMYLGSLIGDVPIRVVDSDDGGAFVAPDHLLTVERGVLTVRHFDIRHPSDTGPPITIDAGFDAPPIIGERSFSVSTTGVLAYRTVAGSRRQLIWTDRTGRTTGDAGPPDDAVVSYVALARDDRSIATVRVTQGNVDVWLRDAIRQTLTRLTLDPSIDGAPVWSPSGDRIGFYSTRRGGNALYTKPSDGSGEEKELRTPFENAVPLDWSSDGQFLLCAVPHPTNLSDLWAIPLFGDRKPLPVVQTPFDDVQGQFSPDARWIAYTSNESGRYEVYVTPFPGPGGRMPLSTAGGIYPRWRRDGKEVFYIAPDNRMMAVSIDLTAVPLRPGAPVALFATNLATGGNVGTTGYLSRAEYAVAADGRFLLNVRVGDLTSSRITVVQHWEALLKR